MNMSFHLPSSVSHLQQKKRSTDYFDNDDDDDDVANNSKIANEDEDDFDPLDAFMAGVEQQVKEEKNTSNNAVLPEIVSGFDDDDYDYENHDYFKIDEDGDNEIQYDSDSEPRAKEKVKIEPLAAVDHLSISYQPFSKCFYQESAEVRCLSEAEVAEYRRTLEVDATGTNVPRPIKSFEHAGFHSELSKAIAKAGFTTPTPIQCQALPVALSGRDMIGLAKTGSGKTMAFVWPMIMHVLDQPQMKLGDGPIGIILSPTRELAAQIYTEAKAFAKSYNIRVESIVGGGGKWEMTKALKESPEIVVGTPGRLIEMVKSKATNLKRCTMVVLDEADRMFEMGFEYQMRSIVNNIRPDRQTLLFSATMKKKVESFARQILTNPIRVVVGSIGQANPDINQVVEIVANDLQKWAWLASRIDEFLAEGKVLIFVCSKQGTEDLSKELRSHFLTRNLQAGIDCLHGDKDQGERTSIMSRFSRAVPASNAPTGDSLVIDILVATDVASRGLDVKDIRTVINFEIPKNIETYVHRIGRTGRMGLSGIVPGTAYSLLTPNNTSFAVDLVRNLRLSSQTVSPSLQRLAESDPRWQLLRGGSSGGRQGAGPAIGIGFGGRGLAPKAMTSAMLAEASAGTEIHSRHFLSVPQSSVAASASSCSSRIESVGPNPYIEGQGMGRGKHLLQPAWMEGTDGRGAAAVPSDHAVSSTRVSLSSAKRQSRFSAVPPPVQQPVLKGFVKASGSFSSVANNHTDSSTGIPAKRSRWE